MQPNVAQCQMPIALEPKAYTHKEHVQHRCTIAVIQKLGFQSPPSRLRLNHAMVQKRKRKRCDFKRYRIDVELYATQSWTDWSTLRTTAILEQSAGLTREQGLALSLKKGKGHRAIRLRVQTGYARSVIRGSSRPRGPDPP